MSRLVIPSARVNGIPGPKGSLNPFCSRCARNGLHQAIVIKEQSEVGAKFRKVVARAMRIHVHGLTASLPYTGAVETRLTFYIHRQKRVRAGVELAEWVPSHETPRPIFRNSGDVEKHARNIHDALMDAGVIADDSQVSDVTARKRWATAEHPPGVELEVWEGIDL